MPSIMWVLKERVLRSPGLTIIAPMTGWNGQQPSMTRTCTSSMRRTSLPALVNENS